MSEVQGPRVMRVRGPQNVKRAEKTDQTLLRFASAITEQRNVASYPCWIKVGQV